MFPPGDVVNDFLPLPLLAPLVGEEEEGDDDDESEAATEAAAAPPPALVWLLKDKGSVPSAPLCCSPALSSLLLWSPSADDMRGINWPSAS